MESITQTELRAVLRRASAINRHSPRSSDRRPELSVSQLAQLVAHILELPLLGGKGAPIGCALPCAAQGWLRKRHLVIEHWCDAMLAFRGQAMRSQWAASRSAASSNVKCATLPALPALPRELVGFAAAASFCHRRFV